jgi:hypothetical protein
LASVRRAWGPATDIAAHWSVTEANCTSSSGQTVWAWNSMCSITRPALAVVVVTKKWSGASRLVVPSSITMPSSRSISP